MSSMIANGSNRDRQRLAWAFLLGSFAFCAFLTMAVPLGVNAALQNTKQLLTISVQASQGTVRIDDEAGSRATVLEGEPGQTAEPGQRIGTDATATALLLVSPPARDPASEERLARMKLYSNTTLQLNRADAPRFDVSEAARVFDANMEGGRVRLTLPESEGRPFVLNFETPQSTVTIREPGHYSVEVDNEKTQVTVQEGQAVVSAVGEILTLQAEQRAEIPLESAPVGPLEPDRNLIRNGDFSDRFDEWALFAWDVELSDQPTGKIDFVTTSGEPALHIIREGQGHAAVKLRQTINQDVTDYASLQLQLTFRIIGQTLGVCGVRGSECPLFIRIDYLDQDGVSRTWQHGFYAIGVVDDNSTPGVCTPCAVVQSEHEQVALGQLYSYDVDVPQELARLGGYLPPRLIKSVSLVASGHSFEVEVVDVALLAQETGENGEQASE